MATMNNIKTALSELKAEAIAIIRNFINTSTPNHQYTWIMVGGKRLIFEKSSVDPDGEIKVWHELREGEKEVREEDYINLSVEEWVEAASKLQKKVVAFEKELLYVNGEVKGYADIEPGQRERNYGWVDYELCRLKLREGVTYELKMERVPQVMTQAEAEVRRFQQIHSGRIGGCKPWSLKIAEDVFSTIWSWQGFGSLDNFCWMKEVEER